MTMVLLIASLCVAVASVVGGLTGFATALMVTPALLLLGFDLQTIVVVNLAFTLITRLLALPTLWDDVDWRAVGFLSAGSLPGAILGILTISFIDQAVLTLYAGIAVTVAGIFMLVDQWLVKKPHSLRWYAYTGVGAVGGYLATTISMNGPPVAILLSRSARTPRQYIADFAGYFVVVNFISLAAIALSGRLVWSTPWYTGPVLIIAAIIGNRIGMGLGSKVPEQLFRTLIAIVVTIAGLVTVFA